MKSQQNDSRAFQKSPTKDSPSSYLLINNLLNINYKINVPKNEFLANNKYDYNGNVTDRSNKSGVKPVVAKRHNLEPKERPNTSSLFTSHKKSNSFSSRVTKDKKYEVPMQSPSWNFLEHETISHRKNLSRDNIGKPATNKNMFHKENLLETIKSSIAKSKISQNGYQSARPKSKEQIVEQKRVLIKEKLAEKSPISRLMKELNTKTFISKPKLDTNLKTKPVKEIKATGNFNNPLHKRTGSLDYGKSNKSAFLDRRSSDFNIAQTKKIRYSTRTRQGYLASYSGKVNQDAVISLPNLFGKKDIHLFAVADGHGVNGHLVSNFVLYHLSTILSKDKDVMINPRKSLMKAFHSVAKSLSESSIDSTMSGTTVNVVLINGPKVFCANCGDSRAFMAKKKTNWEVVPLSRDHKPTSEGEYERIKLMGGRVEPIMESDGSYVGPSRVWLMEDNLPGLAMSRSMGDYIAAQVGVICEPEIIETRLDADCKFIFLASDGVWENIENMECLKMVAPYYETNNIENACDFMLEESYNRWIEDDDDVIDDISFIMIYL